MYRMASSQVGGKRELNMTRMQTVVQVMATWEQISPLTGNRKRASCISEVSYHRLNTAVRAHQEIPDCLGPGWSEGVCHIGVSDSLWPHGLQLARLLCPQNFPGKNTAVGSHPLLQGIFLTQESNPGLLYVSASPAVVEILSRLGFQSGWRNIAVQRVLIFKPHLGLWAQKSRNSLIFNWVHEEFGFYLYSIFHALAWN